MFTAARLKLTFYYLLIIMTVSILFSVVIYNGANGEINRFERLSVVRRDFDFFGTRITREPAFSPTEITQLRNRLIATLILVNLGILCLSSTAGFFLAGKTLKPIEDMVDEQKRFIADASHELRTPLTSLRSEIEVTLRDKGLTLPEAKKLLTSNLEEVDTLQSLSDNLIHLTRFQTPNNNLIFEPLELDQIISAAVKRITPLARKKAIKINLDTEKIALDGDKNSLTELLVIILDNAIKYSPEKTFITLNSKKTANHVIISITDQGIGIPKNEITSVFDRFFRGDKSRTKSEISGYGLGLSIAKQVVEKHNGTIKVDSKINEGSKFTIILPLVKK